jgi:hypothetical protein
MDARSLSAAAGIDVGTLNAWISRDYIPGVTADAQGRRREFGINAALHVGIMAELTRFGFGAPLASMVAKSAVAGGKSCCLITHPIQISETPTAGRTSGWTIMGGFTPTYFDSEKELPKALADLQKRSPAGWGPPSVYTVVNVKRAEARMQQAEKEWQRSRKARDTKADD